MTKKRTITIFISFILILGAGWLFWDLIHFDDLSDKIFRGKTTPGQMTPEEEAAVLGGLVLSESKGDSQYQIAHHPTYKFSFEYPKDMKITAFKEGVGETVLVQNSDKSFQIFVIPFDEPSPITPQRIKQDLPNLVIDNPQEAIVGKDNFRALIFFSHEPSLGQTREVWFIHGGYLYQVITYAQLDEWLGGIMKTWKFD